jgi:Mn-containing catalase
MYANIAAEATGRALATRLYNITDDPGMKDMFSFLIARDTAPAAVGGRAGRARGARRRISDTQ